MNICICAEIERHATRTRIHLVMHRHETFKTSGTARLALHMLECSRGVVRGEPSAVPEGKRLLLFPLPYARALAPTDASDDLVLIVPDGSWAQARKIALRDPAAAEVDAVFLPAVPESRYGLRRRPREGAVCTLEAIAHALEILEGPRVAEPLLAALDRFVVQMRALRGIAQRLETVRETL